MSDKSKIEWTTSTWNPTTGCTKVSPGCDHCYAETLHERFHGKGSFATVALHPDRLDKPLRWRKPRKVFVNSMSDLFHADVPDEYIARVFAIMALAPQHVFQILTKRHGRMRSLLTHRGWRRMCEDAYYEMNHSAYLAGAIRRPPFERNRDKWWSDFSRPLRNVWLGVSVENQQWADIRVPALLDTPAAVRFLSCEPLLGPVQLWDSETCDHTRRTCEEIGCWRALDWVICGGESGPGARPMHPGWARSLRDQCTSAGVPFLFKQWGAHVTEDQMPDDTHMSWDIKHGTGIWHPDVYWRVGKRAAGRELDGRTWDEYPKESA